jgi:hypothetical protein
MRVPIASLIIESMLSCFVKSCNYWKNFICNRGGEEYGKETGSEKIKK